MSTELQKFDVLCQNKMAFVITAGLVLADIGIQKGVDHLIDKYRWYAQIAESINNNDISSITDDEKIEFVKLHIELLDKLKTNPQ